MKKIITLLFFFLLYAGKINSQSVTLSVVQPDCNQDGILQATISGITPPYDLVLYNYNISPSNITATLTNITTFTIQIANLSGFNGYYPYRYIAEIKQGGITAATSPSLTLPTKINASLPFGSTLSYSCPASAASVSLAVTGATSTYTINWENLNTHNYTITGNPCNLPEGIYTYSITDAAGCEYNLGNQFPGPPPLYITYDSGITFSTTSTPANCLNGSASVTTISGGTAPYSYLWNNGLTSSSINNLTQGLKTVKVTDAMGCYSYNYVNITQTPTINAGTTVMNTSCLLSNGSATVFASGGQAPYAYQWFPIGQSASIISNMSAGYYDVRVTDANGCIGNTGANILHTSPIVATYTSSVSQCTVTTGSSTLTLTGGQAPYSVVWNVFPSQTGSVLSNVNSGQYNFTVTDANGCTQSGNVFIGNVSNLGGTIMTTSATCTQNNGVALFSAWGGTIPYTYLWSNSATTSFINNIPHGVYSCTLTDAVNCTLVKSVNVYSISPIQIGFNSTPASCIFTADGAINTSILNGTAPYTYQWSNGVTNANLINQIPGHYYLTVTDAAGCVETDHTYLSSNNSNSNCYCLITGTVYDDANTNCTLDGSETGIPYVRIDCSGIGYAYTDMNGVYSFTVPAGTYTLTEHLITNYQVTGCQNNIAIVVSNPTSGCVIQTDFANTVIPVHDLHVLRYSVNQAVPGNNYQQKMIVYNEGTYNENNIQLSYAHDGQIGFMNSSSPLTQPNVGTYPNWYTVNSGFITVPQYAASVDIFNYFVPTNVPAGTVVDFKDTVSSIAPVSTTWTSDYTPWNNVSDYNVTVVSSYDPNFKEVTPKGTGPYGIISYNDTILEYVIHFQNTGTYYAQNIYVLDTLDSDLDWSTFQPGYADHNYSATMDLNGVVKFSFNNIYLAYNGPASNGMVSYRIKTKRNLAPGTEFRNKAAIFFDYNAPIITNTTINSLQILSGIKEHITENSTLNLYPNPTYNTTLISSQTNFNKIELFSITGQTLLYETINAKTHQLQLQHFAEGIYFVKVSYSDGRSLTKKVIKQ